MLFLFQTEFITRSHDGVWHIFRVSLAKESWNARNQVAPRHAMHLITIRPLTVVARVKGGKYQINVTGTKELSFFSWFTTEGVCRHPKVSVNFPKVLPNRFCFMSEHSRKVPKISEDSRGSTVTMILRPYLYGIGYPRQPFLPRLLYRAQYIWENVVLVAKSKFTLHDFLQL